MPPVQVRAPGMGCVRSRRTWRRAFTTDMGARRREKQHFSRVVGPLWGLAVCDQQAVGVAEDADYKRKYEAVVEELRRLRAKRASEVREIGRLRTKLETYKLQKAEEKVKFVNQPSKLTKHAKKFANSLTAYAPEDRAKVMVAALKVASKGTGRDLREDILLTKGAAKMRKALYKARDLAIQKHLKETVFTPEAFSLLRLITKLSKRECGLIQQSFKYQRAEGGKSQRFKLAPDSEIYYAPEIFSLPEIVKYEREALESTRVEIQGHADKRGADVAGKPYALDRLVNTPRPQPDPPSQPPNNGTAPAAAAPSPPSNQPGTPQTMNSVGQPAAPDLPSFLPAHLKVINESGVTPSFIHHGEKVTAFPDEVAAPKSSTQDIEYEAALDSYEAFNPISAAVVTSDDFGIPSDAIQQAQSGDIGLSKFVAATLKCQADIASRAGTLGVAPHARHPPSMPPPPPSLSPPPPSPPSSPPPSSPSSPPSSQPSSPPPSPPSSPPPSPPSSPPPSPPPSPSPSPPSSPSPSTPSSPPPSPPSSPPPSPPSSPLPSPPTSPRSSRPPTPQPVISLIGATQGELRNMWYQVTPTSTVPPESLTLMNADDDVIRHDIKAWGLPLATSP